MKKLWILFLFLFSLGQVWANSLEVEVDPKNPVVGENFEILFRVETTNDQTPQISFDPNGLDVLGRSNKGSAITSTIINGRISTKRVESWVYEVVAADAKTYRLRNIQLKLGAKTYKHKDVNVKVHRTAVKSPDYMVVAIPSKTEIFLGEGINVDYYLYFKKNVIAEEIQEFPKLNKFTKRFYTPNESVTTVEYNGEVYNRKIKYSVRVYPEKVGTLRIDSLRLIVKYPSSRRASPFGSFGFGIMNSKTRSIRSKTVKIEVKALPTEGVPPHFTGLVGEHDFKITTPKSKYLVNEAIEMKLEVKGEGSLENYDGPKLYSHPDLEEFEKNSELSVERYGDSRKNFDYTYLARSSFELKKKSIPLAYFDPDKLEYVTKRISLPELIVLGGNGISTGTSKGNKIQDFANSPPARKIEKEYGTRLISPVFVKSIADRVGLSYLNLINIVLLLLIVLLLILTFLKYSSNIGPLEGKILLKKIQSEGLSYSLLFSFLDLVRKKSKIEEEAQLKEVVVQSGFSDQCKSYFLNLIEKLERADYVSKEKIKADGHDIKYFKEAIKSLQS